MKNERLDCGSGCSSKASRYGEVFKGLGIWRFYLALPTNLSHKARLGTEAQSCNAAIGIREASKGQSLPSLSAKYSTTGEYQYGVAATTPAWPSPELWKTFPYSLLRTYYVDHVCYNLIHQCLPAYLQLGLLVSIGHAAILIPLLVAVDQGLHRYCGVLPLANVIAMDLLLLEWKFCYE
jgi:hypothetical protein